MDVLMVVLRIIHIVSGVFWGGAAIVGAWFLTPTAASLGPDGQKFMQGLIKRRYSITISAAAALNVLSGLWLYGRISGFRTAWVSTGTGLFLTIGGIAGIAAFLIGFLFITRSAIRMSALGREIQAAGGPPAQPQMAEMQSLREKINKGGIWAAILLLIAVIGMATAQYAWFRL